MSVRGFILCIQNSLLLFNVFWDAKWNFSKLSTHCVLLHFPLKKLEKILQLLTFYGCKREFFSRCTRKVCLWNKTPKTFCECKSFIFLLYSTRVRRWKSWKVCLSLAILHTNIIHKWCHVMLLILLGYNSVFENIISVVVVVVNGIYLFKWHKYSIVLCLIAHSTAKWNF